MPVFRSAPESVDPMLGRELVDLLASELKGAQVPDGPLIFEQEIPQTGTFHVIVVWQRWSDVPPELRAAIVTDAYGRAIPSVAENLTVPVAVTMEEAVEANLLPYQIITLRKKDDPVAVDQLRDAMVEQGAIPTTSGLQLRFPTKDLAETALANLQRQLPGPWWGMQHAVEHADY